MQMPDAVRARRVSSLMASLGCVVGQPLALLRDVLWGGDHPPAPVRSWRVAQRTGPSAARVSAGCPTCDRPRRQRTPTSTNTVASPAPPAGLVWPCTGVLCEVRGMGPMPRNTLQPPPVTLQLPSVTLQLPSVTLQTAVSYSPTAVRYPSTAASYTPTAVSCPPTAVSDPNRRRLPSHRRVPCTHARRGGGRNPS